MSFSVFRIHFFIKMAPTARGPLLMAGLNLLRATPRILSFRATWRVLASLRGHRPRDPVAREFLEVDPVAREVRMAAGSGHIMDPGRAAEIAQFTNAYFAADDPGSGYRGVARFLRFARTSRTTAEYFAPIDLLRRKAGSNMQIRGSSPETFASAMCARTVR